MHAFHYGQIFFCLIVDIFNNTTNISFCIHRWMELVNKPLGQFTACSATRLSQFRFSFDTKLISDDRPSSLINDFRIKEQSVHIKDRALFHEPLHRCRLSHAKLHA